MRGNLLMTDRADAGRRLAALLRNRELHRPIVLAIPRGGVPTGAALAHELGADLDIILARKLRAPMKPDLVLGAVGENGRVHLNELGRDLQLNPEELAQESSAAIENIERRRALYREDRPPPTVAGRSVIVADDGLATGSTMIAALQTLHGRRGISPREIIVAVPVGTPERLQEIETMCDEVLCLFSPPDFVAISQFFREFDEVTDAEAVSILRAFRQSKASATMDALSPASARNSAPET